MMSKIVIDGIKIGSDFPTYLIAEIAEIAEIAANHDVDLLNPSNWMKL